MVLGPLMILVGRHLIIQRRVFLLEIYIESMLDESGFGAATEMGGFTAESTRSILGTRTFFNIRLHFIRVR